MRSVLADPQGPSEEATSEIAWPGRTAPTETVAWPETGADGICASLVNAAQLGDACAIEALLELFRPLLRSRLHVLWSALSGQLTTLEWSDVESQVTLLFLSRLHTFQPEKGIYFAHYMARMLELDCGAWMRRQLVSTDVPFSQLSPGDDAQSAEDWLTARDETAHDETSVLELAVSLRSALDHLTPAQREVVWECCVLHHTEEDVARALGISRSATRNRLAGALTRLRQFFHHDELHLLHPVAETRTGRAAQVGHTLWRAKLNMAKDEKRPDLVGVGAGQPVLLQGTFDFQPTGLRTPKLLSPKLCYTVPAGCVAGIRFFRVGILCNRMVCLSTVVNGITHRLVPVAANATVHVPFAIVEPIRAGSQIEIHIAADEPGIIFIDVGCLQMPA